jgi:hypothetical protein
MIPLPKLPKVASAVDIDRLPVSSFESPKKDLKQDQYEDEIFKHGQSSEMIDESE